MDIHILQYSLLLFNISSERWLVALYGSQWAPFSNVLPLPQTSSYAVANDHAKPAAARASFRRLFL